MAAVFLRSLLCRIQINVLFCKGKMLGADELKYVMSTFLSYNEMILTVF